MAVPRKIQIVSAFAALYLIWGSTYLGILFAIQSIPPFLMAGARFSFAGLIMFVIARTQGSLRSTWAEWRTSLIVGACLLLGGNGGVTISEKFIETGLASLIVATVPIYIILLGWLFGMTPQPGGIVWLGLAGGLLGVGYTAYFWLLRNCDSAKVATYAYINPIVAVLLGALFAHEVVTLRTVLAAALIIGSVALIITVQQLKPKALPPITAAIETECAR